MSVAKQPIRAYGDRRDDGVMQLSFTLPIPLSEKAKEAAQLLRRLRQEPGGPRLRGHRRPGGGV